MKKIAHFGTLLLLLIGIFANTTMAQGVFTWNGNISTSWTTAGNWTKTGSATSETYPGEFNSTNTVTIINTTVNAPVIASGSYKISRLNVNNSATNLTGGTLTINSGATLIVDGTTAGIVTLNGGNIMNDGTLSIKSTSTGSNGFLTTGITCATPSSPPTVATEYGYTGGSNSNLIIDISGAVYLGAAAVSVTGLNADTTYKMIFNGTTTISLGTALTYVNATSNPVNQVQPTNFFAFRAAGGANASKLIVGGTGFTLGSGSSPIINGGLFSVGAQSTVTVNVGTNLTMHSSSTNVTRGIHFSSAITNATTFTNKGIINILGSSSTSGILLTTFTAGADLLLDINNEGTLNVDLNCTTVGSAPLATGNGGSTATTTTAFKINNIGTNSILTLKNRATAAGTGAAIFGFVAGQAPPIVITNGGTLNLEGSSFSYGNKFSITNNSILNTNSELRNFTAVTNNVGGNINFVRTAATATSRQLVFNGLQTTDVSGAIGNIYTDGTNNYVVVSQKFASGTSLVTNVLSTAIIPTSGTLTLSSGTGGTTPLTFTSVSAPALNGALTSTTNNSGTINTDTASNLSIISGVTTTSNSIIAPAGSAGKGIASFSAASQTIIGTISIEVAGNTTAGVDYDQITNSATNGGFDISGATLEITSLYTPTSSVSIPIVTASAGGTISGTFPSVTGLTTGWIIDYSVPTAVNLVYTVVIVLPPPTIWTGAADNNFFNEANWINTANSTVPDTNSINPAEDINLNLQINSASATITSGVIQFGTGRLAIGSANVTATSLSGGTVTINNDGYLNLSSATPFLNNVQVNFTSGIGWIKTPNYNASAVSSANLGQIKVNGSPAVYASNLRLDQYYLNGCVIRANLTTTSPLTVYDSANLGGSSAAITVNTIHSNSAIENSMNNRIESFLLKKGFMVTVAIENDGTGKSKNYIASESDLVINVLPQTLQNSISFIRVMPWNWVTKKGFNAPIDDNLNASWRYQWNPNDSSTIDWEFAPMTWGHTSANDPADITLLVDKYNSPYVMSFNEPDDCDGQSGLYGDLCQTDVAVGYHKNLMKTGMRIVSPGGREEAPFGWLEEFYNKATAQDVRVDVIAVHWYDWSAVLNSNPNDDTAALAAGRFIAYLNNVHNLYGLPIWITEFNANPARSQAINAEFLRIVLPQLESLDYIERYCWFPFNTGTHFTTGWDEINRVPTNTIPSLVGTIYKNINNTTPVNSTPSIPEATVNADNSLDLSSYPNVALNKPAIASSNLTNLGPDKAVDGDKTTSASRWVVELATLPAWIEVDLQDGFLVDSFRITEDVNTVKDFRFEVWDATLNSGVGNWVSVLTVTGNLATPLTTFRRITPVNTTKVRLFVTAHNAGDRMRIFELEVFGTPSRPVWTGNTSTSWSTASNWSTGIVPDQFSNVLISGGATFQPTISATTTINSLAIAAGAELIVSAPNFTVKGPIDTDGTMTLSNNSNLLQGEEFNPNTGNVNINRNSSALSRLDYTIWSSPVENQNLATFSPATSLNRFYNYNQTSNLYNAIANPSTTAFGLAAGHLIRMPNTHPTTATVWNGTFTGVPNNGTITRVVTYRNEDPFNFGYNMIGNPYPSTLNANAFITENTTKIENILYFWRKTNAALGSAYATWINGIGGTASGAGSAVPNGTIQVGQGFFVRAKPGTNLTLLTFNQTLTFKNAMRLGNTSTQFFKTKQEEKDRLWLNLTNTAGVFSQALIGYISEATMGIDGYDGRYINDSPVALTSNINDEEYTIQGRPIFDPSDVVSLNFKTDLGGEYTIAIDHLDGVFAKGQDVFLVDKTTGTETDLKTSTYTFTTVAGTFNDRFSVKYQKTLKVEALDFNENNVRVYKNNGTIHVKSGTVAISNIKVYDIQGRLIAEQNNVKSTTATINNLKALHQVLIVKITGEDNNVVSKKVVN